jgi:hypothetical protein
MANEPIYQVIDATDAEPAKPLPAYLPQDANELVLGHEDLHHRDARHLPPTLRPANQSVPEAVRLHRDHERVGLSSRSQRQSTLLAGPLQANRPPGTHP